MKTVGIIAEYNPFHSGHQYQIAMARRLTGADFVVVVMSGDFVQRGEPAVFDKYTRTAMALEGGADLVLEMPVRFATSSAEDFAACGVALLDRLGVTDVLCFGSELGRLDLLEQAAGILAAEPEAFRQKLRQGLAAGMSFPKAREAALVRELEACGLKEKGQDDWQKVLSSPNNILGIEYLKALKRRGSRISPLTVRRQGQDYHDTRLLPEDNRFFPSASAIRKAYRDAACPGWSGPVSQDPSGTGWSGPGSQDPSGAGCNGSGGTRPAVPVPIFPDDLSGLLDARLLELSRQNQDLTRFADVSPELAARIRRNLLEFDTFSGRIARLKTRQLPYTRISRALVHILLGITAEEISVSRSLDYAPYIRILGFRKAAGDLLGAIRRRCPLPMVTRTAGALRQMEDSPALDMLYQDICASHLYQSLVFHKSGGRMKNEYTQPVVIRHL